MKDEIYYYEAFKKRGDPDWYWKVYRYDATGEREISVAKAGTGFATKEGALDAATEYCDERDIAAGMAE